MSTTKTACCGIRCRYASRALPNATATVLTLHLRLSGLYKDLASLSIGGYSGGIEPLNHQKSGRRREARKRAGEYLLRQMAAAGDEARYEQCALSLSHVRWFWALQRVSGGWKLEGGKYPI